jgi:hypothetical protein
VFDVVDDAGTMLVSSAPYRTICKLEAGLRVLLDAARAPYDAAIKLIPGAFDIRPSQRRSRVLLSGALPVNSVRAMLSALSEVEVVDARLPTERRIALSGRLCQFEH